MKIDQVEQELSMKLAMEISHLVENAETKNHLSDFFALFSVVGGIHHSALQQVPPKIRKEVSQQARKMFHQMVDDILDLKVPPEYLAEVSKKEH